MEAGEGSRGEAAGTGAVRQGGDCSGAGPSSRTRAPTLLRMDWSPLLLSTDWRDWTLCSLACCDLVLVRGVVGELWSVGVSADGGAPGCCVQTVNRAAYLQQLRLAAAKTARAGSEQLQAAVERAKKEAEEANAKLGRWVGGGQVFACCC